MSRLKDKLLAVVLEEIWDKLRLDHAGGVCFGPFAFASSVNIENQRIFSAVLKLEVISEEELRRAVHARLCSYGRSMLGQVVQHHEYPDHVSSPPALAYALCHDDLTRSIVDARGISFDHGETPESYKARADGLLDKVMAQLVDGPAPAAEASMDDRVGTVCEGCGE